MSEQTFYTGKGVTVTNSRFMVSGQTEKWGGQTPFDQTYAMQGVTSIRRDRMQPSRKWPIIIIVIGAIVTLSSFGVFGSSVGIGIVTLLVGLAILAGGIMWFRALNMLHLVILQTAGGESRAVWSKDETFITQVVQALNQAISARG